MEPQHSELQDILRQNAAGRLELLGSYGQSNFAPPYSPRHRRPRTACGMLRCWPSKMIRA